GDTRALADALDAHREVEGHGAGLDLARDRRGVLRVGRAGERDVTLAGEQSRGGIEPDPAGAGKVDLGPGMQVGEVALGPRRSVERCQVRLQLDQIAAGEAGREAEVTEYLHQQPGGVATGSGAEAERLVAGLDAGLQTDDVADVTLETLVERDQEVHGAG